MLGLFSCARAVCTETNFGLAPSLVSFRHGVLQSMDQKGELVLNLVNKETSFVRSYYYSHSFTAYIPEMVSFTFQAPSLQQHNIDKKLT